MGEKTIEVAIGVLIESRAGAWRVLIARRPADGVLGGYWEFPGGKREPGESLAACLVREFQEELGLSVTPGEPLPVIEHQYDHGRVRLCPFFCRQAAPGTPCALGVSEWRWVAAETLSTYRFPPANAALLDQLRQALCQLPEAPPKTTSESPPDGEPGPAGKSSP